MEAMEAWEDEALLIEKWLLALLALRSTIQVETPILAELHLAFDPLSVVGVLIHLFLQSLNAFVRTPQ